jgi:hypothetical protein
MALLDEMSRFSAAARMLSSRRVALSSTFLFIVRQRKAIFCNVWALPGRRLLAELGRNLDELDEAVSRAEEGFRKQRAARVAAARRLAVRLDWMLCTEVGYTEIAHIEGHSAGCRYRGTKGNGHWVAGLSGTLSIS